MMNNDLSDSTASSVNHSDNVLPPKSLVKRNPSWLSTILSYSSFFSKFCPFKKLPQDSHRLRLRRCGPNRMKCYAELFCRPTNNKLQHICAAFRLKSSKSASDRAKLSRLLGLNEPFMDSNDQSSFEQAPELPLDPEAEKVIKKILQTCEVMRTSLSEVYSKLNNLDEKDPLIKYLMRVSVILRRYLHALNAHSIPDSETLKLAKKVDTVMIQMEQIRLYYKTPGSDFMARVLAVSERMEILYQNL